MKKWLFGAILLMANGFVDTVVSHEGVRNKTPVRLLRPTICYTAHIQEIL